MLSDINKTNQSISSPGLMGLALPMHLSLSEFERLASELKLSANLSALIELYRSSRVVELQEIADLQEISPTSERATVFDIGGFIKSAYACVTHECLIDLLNLDSSAYQERTLLASYPEALAVIYLLGGLPSLKQYLQLAFPTIKIHVLKWAIRENHHVLAQFLYDTPGLVTQAMNFHQLFKFAGQYGPETSINLLFNQPQVLSSLDSYRSAHLYEACISGHNLIMNHLLRVTRASNAELQGFWVNYAGALLEVSIRQGDKEVAYKFFKIEIVAEHFNKHAPYFLNLAAKLNNFDFVELCFQLLNVTPSLKHCHEMVVLAAQNGQLTILQRCLKVPELLESFSCQSTGFKRALLSQSVKDNRLDILAVLINLPEYQETLVAHAYQFFLNSYHLPNFEVTDYLLANPEFVESLSTHGNALLAMAAEDANIHMIVKLLRMPSFRNQVEPKALLEDAMQPADTIIGQGLLIVLCEILIAQPGLEYASMEHVHRFARTYILETQFIPNHTIEQIEVLLRSLSHNYLILYTALCAESEKLARLLSIKAFRQGRLKFGSAQIDNLIDTTLCQMFESSMKTQQQDTPINISAQGSELEVNWSVITRPPSARTLRFLNARPRALDSSLSQAQKAKDLKKRRLSR